MKAVMIGCGKLGLPVAEVMAQHHDVVGYDVETRLPENFLMFYDLATACRGRNIIFLALPTPHDPRYDGSRPIVDSEPRDFGYGEVMRVMEQLNDHCDGSQLVVLISTTLPGTVRNKLAQLARTYRFVYNPYLIAMGTVKWDMINPEMIIIGTEEGKRSNDAQTLIDFYEPMMQNKPRYVIGTWDEAESIKIFYNTFISTKITLVNMIQDVAQRNGNINVDVVTEALADSTQRITGSRYMKAGMGDAGPCHPRDNLALRHLAQRLDLGYDLFRGIMQAREQQARNLAQFLVDLANERDLPIVIHGEAYKPNVSYTDGSYSLLVGHYCTEMGKTVTYVDPLTANNRIDNVTAVVLIAHAPSVTYNNADCYDKLQFYCKINKGSVVVDPWRLLPRQDVDYEVIHYGDTRPANH